MQCNQRLQDHSFFRQNKYGNEFEGFYFSIRSCMCAYSKCLNTLGIFAWLFGRMLLFYTPGFNYEEISVHFFYRLWFFRYSNSNCFSLQFL